MRRATALGLIATAPLAGCARRADLAIGSKDFTEELVLGELYAYVLEKHGVSVRRRLDLAGTDIAMTALQRGEIDLYPEYTGTALLVVLKAAPLADGRAIYQTVKREYERRYGLTWLAPAPMNDTQALATTRAIAARFGLRTLSDCARLAPQLRLGAVPEFAKRADGLPGLQRAYGGFAFKETRLLDYGLKYRALLDGKVDVVVAFGTDGPIKANDLVVLADDRRFWPIYNVAPVVRSATLQKYPQIAAALDRIAPLLTDDVARTLNDQVDGTAKRSPADVARAFADAHGLA